MKRITILLSLIFIILSSSVFAQNARKTVAILDFKTSSIETDEMRVFLDYITSHIVATGLYRVIDREQRENMLAEISFSTSGIADDKAQLEIGKVLSADYIIVGSIGRVGDRFLLNIKLVEVVTGETVNSSSMAYGSINELIDYSKDVTLALFGLSGSPAVTVDEAEKTADTGDQKSTAGTTTEDDTGYVPPPPSPAPAVKHHSIEAFLGYTFEKEFMPNISLTAGYMYGFSRTFYLGAWGGAMLQSGKVSPLVGAKVVFGNKVDGFAVSVNLGLPSGVGIYFRNISINIYPIIIFSLERYIMVEAGYSFSF